MLPRVRDGIFSQQRASSRQLACQLFINPCVAERRRKSSFRENGQRLSRRKMPRPKQYAALRNFERRIHNACDVARIHIACVRNHAREGPRFFLPTGAKTINLAGELPRLRRIEESGNSRGTDHAAVVPQEGSNGPRAHDFGRKTEKERAVSHSTSAIRKGGVHSAQ